MSEPVETPDADAWATACAEDLAAEKARRRGRYGPPPGSAAEELRRLADVLADKLSGGGSLLGFAGQSAAQQVVQQAVRQARAAVEPVIERNPDLFDHLAAAGSELLAAYRSAVESQEGRWTRTAADQDPAPADRGERPLLDKRDGPSGTGRAGEDGPREPGAGGTSGREDGATGPSDGRHDPGDEGPASGEHIDLD
ncbi:DUF5304 domain-containing protein [Streptomyces sp. NPDC050560]|uniref:DUF5304 domain-containing protein n=1 Tax=Streptomyces sp. NPDC050560 TaxID=3365630 RepID=UPI0037AE6A6E